MTVFYLAEGCKGDFDPRLFEKKSDAIKCAKEYMENHIMRNQKYIIENSRDKTFFICQECDETLLVGKIFLEKASSVRGEK